MPGRVNLSPNVTSRLRAASARALHRQQAERKPRRADAKAVWQGESGPMRKCAPKVPVRAAPFRSSGPVQHAQLSSAQCSATNHGSGTLGSKAFDGPMVCSVKGSSEYGSEVS